MKCNIDFLRNYLWKGAWGRLFSLHALEHEASGEAAVEAGWAAGGLGAVGECVCPNGGYRTTHQAGSPCHEIQFPSCGAPMRL
jgi:hypothetical protein